MTTCTLYEALEIFEENLPEVRKSLLANAQDLIKEYSPYKEMDVDELITKESVHAAVNFALIESKVKPLFETIRRIDSFRQFKQNPVAGGITSADIDRARNASEDWFIFQASLSTRKPHKGMCPFHDDRSPSLTLMQSPKSKKYYLKCFVCNDAWDSIKFIMTRDNLSFPEAVRVIIS